MAPNRISNMKSNITIAAFTGFLGLAALGHGQDVFVSPGISCDIPSTKVIFIDGNTKALGAAMGFQIAGGAAFGAQDQNEFRLGLGYSDFNVSEAITSSFSSFDNGVSYSSGYEKVKVQAIPLLLDYRYYFGRTTSFARFHLGPIVGFTRSKATITLTGVETTGGAVDTATSEDSRTDFTWGWGFGVAFRITERADLDFNYTYTSAKVWETSLDIHSLHASLIYRF